MIVFTLGTIFFPFERSVNWLQELLDNEIITEPVLLQHGATSANKLSHPLLTSVVSLTRNQMYEAVKQSSLVISHAGQGSTRMLAEMEASFVLLPRLKRYGEHVDDHQLLFARAVERFGVQHCTEFSQLIKHVQEPPFRFEGKLFNAPLLAEYLTKRYKNLQIQESIQGLGLPTTAYID